LRDLREPNVAGRVGDQLLPHVDLAGRHQPRTQPPLPENADRTVVVRIAIEVWAGGRRRTVVGEASGSAG
jgi:hypothetical protein